VYHLLLPDQLLGPTLTTSELASQVLSSAGPGIISTVIGDSPSASQAQHAVAAALMMAAGLPVHGSPPGTTPAANSQPGPSRHSRCDSRAARCAASSRSRAAGVTNQPPQATLGSAAYAAAQRFAALPPSARHAWLVQHVTALRAGRITVAQLP
jgi:hypothetical protein